MCYEEWSRKWLTWTDMLTTASTSIGHSFSIFSNTLQMSWSARPSLWSGTRWRLVNTKAICFGVSTWTLTRSLSHMASASWSMRETSSCSLELSSRARKLASSVSFSLTHWRVATLLNSLLSKDAWTVQPLLRELTAVSRLEAIRMTSSTVSGATDSSTAALRPRLSWMVSLLGRMSEAIEVVGFYVNYLQHGYFELLNLLIEWCN